MDQRYQIFAKVNVRNISGFNQRGRRSAPSPPPDGRRLAPGVDAWTTGS